MIGQTRSRIAGLATVWSIALLVAGQHAIAEPNESTMRSLVADYAHAVETNNRKLALSYVHPRSPQRAEIDAALREQLTWYMERARTSHLEPSRLPDGTASARVEQEIIRVFGMKFTRATRRSIYHFREFDGSWHIWEIEVAGAPWQRPKITLEESLLELQRVRGTRA
jgi:hypothetical protein